MSFTFLKKAIAVIVVFQLFGCSGDADEAKKLGFSSVDEMRQIQAKGWHTQTKYEEDTAKPAGSNSVVEMSAAAANKPSPDQKNDRANNSSVNFASDAGYNLSDIATQVGIQNMIECELISFEFSTQLKGEGDSAALLKVSKGILNTYSALLKASKYQKEMEIYSSAYVKSHTNQTLEEKMQIIQSCFQNPIVSPLIIHMSKQ